MTNEMEMEAEGIIPRPEPKTTEILPHLQESLDGLQQWATLEGVPEDIPEYVNPDPVLAEHAVDVDAVLQTANAMIEKLWISNAIKGRGGWRDPQQCKTGELLVSLVHHIAKGDFIDVANFAMMLWFRQAETDDEGFPAWREELDQIIQGWAEQKLDERYAQCQKIYEESEKQRLEELAAERRAEIGLAEGQELTIQTLARAKYALANYINTIEDALAERLPRGSRLKIEFGREALNTTVDFHLEVGK